MIVLDTHIWLWWLKLDDNTLKRSWRDAIARLIIATAIVNDSHLISADGHFPAYGQLEGRLIP